MNRWFFYSIGLALLFLANGHGGEVGRPTRVTVTVYGAAPLKKGGPSIWVSDLTQ